MATPRQAARAATVATSHFALVEPLPGATLSENDAELPALAGSALKGVLREAYELALRGAAGRISPDQLMAEWTGFFTPEELFAVVIPARTFARRKSKREPLTVEETERALRLARISTEAIRVFANPAKASRWLRKPNRALGHQTPLSLLETETGARTVEELLGQIDHGMFI